MGEGLWEIDPTVMDSDTIDSDTMAEAVDGTDIVVNDRNVVGTDDEMQLGDGDGVSTASSSGGSHAAAAPTPVAQEVGGLSVKRRKGGARNICIRTIPIGHGVLYAESS